MASLLFYFSKGTFAVNYSLMKPKRTNPIDLANGCNFILACTNNQIICFLCAFIQYVLEARYQDFPKKKTCCVCMSFGVPLV